MKVVVCYDTHLYRQINVALRVWRRDGCKTAIVAPTIRHVIHVNGSERIGGYLLSTAEKKSYSIK